MAELHALLTGLAMGESPRWHNGRLWLADWGTSEILVVDGGGARTHIASAPSVPCSIDWLPNGEMLVVSGGDGRLLRSGPDGALRPYADLHSLAPHPWNELVVDGRGNVYVNTIGFDFPEGAFAPGLIALVTPDGAVRHVADNVAFPNGMAVTPDNATLIVAESYGNRLSAFDIAPDGGLANRRVWADLPGAYPDGICLDAEGAVWYADVPNKRCVRVREGGAVLETIDVGLGCFACMLGGEAGTTLLIVAAAWGGEDGMADGQRTGAVFRVDVRAPRAGWP
ncbi:MAG TPA: SMP-30/gluconolactonase/LRE family protein [Roseiflexaceae bacterium]|nr:SMP-30/gluconolactonase/LRE family protein [Roseiflexaceae bacterium]